jgi:Leishmanolysin/Bacterial Ig-like domain (group 1)
MQRILTLALAVAIVACGGDSTAPPPVPHVLQLTASGPTSIAAGGSVQLVTVVIDDHGTPMSGQPVAFSISNPALGSLSVAGLFTSNGTVGSTTITATSTNLSNSISITVGHGSPAAIVISGGNSQTGFVRAALPISPAVQVRDQFGNAIPGASVTFAVTTGGGIVGSPTATTDSNGNATTSWTLGASVGTNRMVASSPGVASVSFDAAGDSPYHIEIVYSPEVSSLERSVVDLAIAHWRRIITTDIGAVQFGAAGGGCGTNPIAPNDIVHGLRIYVKDTAMASTSNLLAAAGVCYENSNHLPVVATFFWNTTQAANISTAGEVIATHELGHAMGFGTLWPTESLLVGAGTSDPFFIGAQARSTFGSTFGAGYVGNSIPVENTGGPGTADAHWRETVFNHELMTGFISAGANPLSAVTIAQFADLGYTVDMSQSEIFLGNILAPGSAMPATSRLSLGNDVIRLPIRSVPSLRH